MNPRELEQDGAIQNGAFPPVTKPTINQGDMAVMQSMEGSAVPYEPPDPVSGFDVLTAKIGAKELEEAEVTLQKYKTGKANLERRIIDNQEWYKLRQWEILRRKARTNADPELRKQMVEPTSGWLVNSIDNKHATAMDNFPRANIQPREAGDQIEAQKLSSVLPVILDQCEFEQTYSDVTYDKLINGTGIYGIFWDPSKLNGLGDVDIEAIDILNIFWEPGIQDIDRSRNIFYVTLADNDLLEEEHPELKNRLGGKVMNISEYVYDDTVDTSEKSIVVDWYYKKKQNGRNVLHYCKFVMGQTEPLFATENDPEYAERGWYDDGEYPFVFDKMFPCKGTPCGYGFIDKGKNAQEFIDRADQGILKNLLFNAKPRHFIRSDGAVNEEEYADSECDLVHVDGNLGTDSVMPIQVNPLSSIYLEIQNNKINELKETTGNRDVNTGGTTGGVTAASAIAAQQEAGAKLDRDNSKAEFRAFRKVTVKIIERLRQFYDQPRFFRIMGENGMAEFMQFSNAGIVPQHQGYDFGIDMGYRIPYFDIEITAEKASPYSRMSQNELSLQFYSAGFFAPQNAAPALACLSMMDFDHKNDVIKVVAQNGTMYQMMIQAQQQALQLAQLVDGQNGSQLAPALMQQYGMQMQPEVGSPLPGKAAAQRQEALGGETGSESPVTANARKRTAEMSAPQ